MSLQGHWRRSGILSGATALFPSVPSVAVRGSGCQDKRRSARRLAETVRRFNAWLTHVDPEYGPQFDTGLNGNVEVDGTYNERLAMYL